jgi:hypothetical protein
VDRKRSKRLVLLVGAVVLSLVGGQLYVAKRSLGSQLSHLAKEYGLSDSHLPDPFRQPAVGRQVIYESTGLTTREKEQFVSRVEGILESHGLVDMDTANGKRHAYARNRRWNAISFGVSTDVHLVCGAVETEIWIEEQGTPSVLTLLGDWFRRLLGRP